MRPILFSNCRYTKLIWTGVPSPPHFFTPLNTLLPLCTKMQSILHPSNSTPKTQSIIQPIFDGAMASFAELRGEWIRRSLGVMVNRVEEVDEGGIWEGGRGREKVRGLVGLWELLVIILEVSLYRGPLMFVLMGGGRDTPDQHSFPYPPSGQPSPSDSHPTPRTSHYRGPTYTQYHQACPFFTHLRRP